jgi:CheY-like chemotaxis protein
LESTSSNGTTFRVALAADLMTTAEELPLKGRPQGVSRFRLLIVDDEVRLARSLAALLSSHEVEVASSVVEALALLAKDPFDCILCDLMMPTLSGMDLHAELERRGRGEERRMIFMTGGAFTPRAREFIASVPNHVLEKPFSADSVEALVASMIAGHA